MRRGPRARPAAVVAAREAAAAAEAAALIEIVTAIAIAAAVAGAEIRARVAGSQPRIIATVPGSLESLAGNTQ